MFYVRLYDLLCVLRGKEGGGGWYKINNSIIYFFNYYDVREGYLRYIYIYTYTYDVF